MWTINCCQWIEKGGLLYYAIVQDCTAEQTPVHIVGYGQIDLHFPSALMDPYLPVANTSMPFLGIIIPFVMLELFTPCIHEMRLMYEIALHVS